MHLIVCVFLQCHPKRSDFLVGIADFSTQEHAFNEGEYIMRQGDAGERIIPFNRVLLCVCVCVFVCVCVCVCVCVNQNE